MSKQLIGPRQRKWLDALLSQKYKQGNKVLHNTKNDTWCCLGVACDLFGADIQLVRCSIDGMESFGCETQVAPRELASHLGIANAFGSIISSRVGAERVDRSSLAALNDSGKTFEEIVALIESDPAAYFTSPK